MTRQALCESLSTLLLALVVGMFWYHAATRLQAPVSTPMSFQWTAVDWPRSPAALGAAEQHRPREPSLRLAFVGDIMQHRAQARDDFAASYAALRPRLQSADLAVGNLEFPVDPTRPVGPPPDSARFNGSPAHVEALAATGFDVLSTSNNHTFDQGLTGLQRTLNRIADAGMQSVGNHAGPDLDRPLIVERQGFKIGFYAYTFRPNSYKNASGETEYWQADWPIHELNFFDWTAEYRAKGQGLFARHQQAAREAGVDWLVALVHWGYEWRFQPSDDQRRAGHDLLDQGFDLVVGGHGHVINPVEVHSGKLIAYSLGNFNCDFRPPDARLGGLLEVDLDQGEDGRLHVADFRVIPTTVDLAGHRVRPLVEHSAADRRNRQRARQVLGDACWFWDGR